jgi:flagella synthesis protein FlgN
MQPGAAQRNAFVSALRAELAGFRALLQTLLAEQECLLRADAQALPDLTEVKSRQIELLHGLAGQRAVYLASLNFEPGRRGMQEWLAGAGAEKRELTALWQELLDAAAGARALNNSNGGLIGARVNHNQAALGALHTAARSLGTYGPDGQPRLPAGQRELGKA